MVHVESTTVQSNLENKVNINFLKLAGVLEGFPSNVEHNLPKKNLRKQFFQPTHMLLAF